MKKRISIVKGLIYSGTASDKVAEEAALSTRRNIGGTITKEPDGADTWVIFPDRIAEDLFHGMKEKLYFDAVLDAVQNSAARAESESSSSPSLPSERAKRFGEYLSKRPSKRGDMVEVDEEELRRGLVSELNGDTMHEICLHAMADLGHIEFPVEINCRYFPLWKTPIELPYVKMLLEKHGLTGKCGGLYMDGCYVVSITFETPKTTDDVYTDEMMKTARSIDAMFKEMQSDYTNIGIRYSDQQFPVEFGLNDIKITEAEPYKANVVRKSVKKN
jgi:hypothetical protein